MQRGTQVVVAGILACGPAAIAGADFTGLVIEPTDSGVLRLYAVFDHPGDAVANVFNSNITNNDGWSHDDIAGGTWLPLPGGGDADSFVTIGAEPGWPPVENATTLDPNFDNNTDGQTSLGTNAGWFNSNPPNQQGLAGEDGRVLLAQFSGGTTSGDLELTYTTAAGDTRFASGEFPTVVNGAWGWGIGVPPCLADLDGDGYIDGLDLGLLLGSWGSDDLGDVNADGTVDGMDVGVLLGSWGQCVDDERPCDASDVVDAWRKVSVLADDPSWSDTSMLCGPWGREGLAHWDEVDDYYPIWGTTHAEASQSSDIQPTWVTGVGRAFGHVNGALAGSYVGNSEMTVSLDLPTATAWSLSGTLVADTVVSWAGGEGQADIAIVGAQGPIVEFNAYVSGSDGLLVVPVMDGGVLPPGEYTLTVSAKAWGAASGSLTSDVSEASFDFVFTYVPQQ